MLARGDLVVKECEILADLISKVSDLQAQARRTCGTVWLTAMGFGFQTGNPKLHILAAIAGAICWWQDARYLAKRRALRARYCTLARALAIDLEAPAIADPMAINGETTAGDVVRAIVSPSLWVFYTALIVIGIGVWYRRAVLGVP